ncbi:MAG TPA: alpha-glucosidase C-terminal domain-containing protein, partial [Candidatus Krumholzibacterium sp.]|nr:alpha-glucosidase C-terminal domain-containing protein [Candidatus Krumholzibacterium sp.]
KMAALFQMTYVGIPQIYYGDEVGLKGGRDPDCRRTFPWNWEEVDRRRGLHDYYRKIIGIRHEYSALRTGDFRTVLAEGKIYAYVREDDDDRIVVVLNNDAGARDVVLHLGPFGFADGDSLKDEIGGSVRQVEGGIIELELAGMTGMILVLQ